MGLKKRPLIMFDNLEGVLKLGEKEVKFTLNGNMMFDLEDLAYALCVFVPCDELMEWIEYLKGKAQKWKETHQWGE